MSSRTLWSELWSIFFRKPVSTGNVLVVTVDSWQLKQVPAVKFTPNVVLRCWNEAVPTHLWPLEQQEQRPAALRNVLCSKAMTLSLWTLTPGLCKSLMYSCVADELQLQWTRVDCNVLAVYLHLYFRQQLFGDTLTTTRWPVSAISWHVLAKSLGCCTFGLWQPKAQSTHGCFLCHKEFLVSCL